MQTKEVTTRKRSPLSGLMTLILVVAIVLTMAAIAIPNLLRSRSAANEASAVGSLRTIDTAVASYSAQHPGDAYM